MRARAAILFSAALGALLASCGKPGPGDEVVITLDDPAVMPVTDPSTPMEGEEIRTWASAPWTGHDWLDYPGHVQLDVEHGLGREPNGVLVYIAFTQDGASPGLAAGDLAQIRAVDANHVVVWNNTNAHYYVRIVVF